MKSVNRSIHSLLHTHSPTLGRDTPCCSNQFRPTSISLPCSILPTQRVTVILRLIYFECPPLLSNLPRYFISVCGTPSVDSNELETLFLHLFQPRSAVVFDSIFVVELHSHENVDFENFVSCWLSFENGFRKITGFRKRKAVGKLTMFD